VHSIMLLREEISFFYLETSNTSRLDGYAISLIIAQLEGTIQNCSASA